MASYLIMEIQVMLTEILERWEITSESSLAFGNNGEIKDNAELFEVINPSTESVIFKAKYASMASNEQIIQQAIQAQNQFKIVPAPVRGKLVFELGLLLRKHKHDLAMVMSHEIGKTLKESIGEIQEMIDMADLAVGQSRMLNGLTMHSERPEHRMYEQWHPLGIVAVITAFNFPAAVWAWNAMIAIIAGNVVLWKPSPKAALTSILIQKICYEATKTCNLPNVFYLSLVPNDQVEQAISNNHQIPLVSFTGSTTVGRKVASTVAARLGRSLLELSGNNASIVCQDADLSLVLPAVLFAAVGTSGQRCTTLRRLYVHESILDCLLTKLINAYKQLKVSDPWLEDALLGPLIDSKALEQFLQIVKTAKMLGGTAHVGGKRVDRQGFFVEPTIIAAEHDWPILQQELFAPILYIVPFKDLDQAIEYQNSSKHGLSSSIFSNDLKQVEMFLSSLGSDCGIANVNMGPSGAEIGGAFGGEKDTGGGREAGSDAWKAYMRRQTCTINWGNQLPLAQGITFE